MARAQCIKPRSQDDIAFIKACRQFPFHVALHVFGKRKIFLAKGSCDSKHEILPHCQQGGSSDLRKSVMITRTGRMAIGLWIVGQIDFNSDPTTDV